MDSLTSQCCRVVTSEVDTTAVPYGGSESGGDTQELIYRARYLGACLLICVCVCLLYLCENVCVRVRACVRE